LGVEQAAETDKPEAVVFVVSGLALSEIFVFKKPLIDTDFNGFIRMGCGNKF